MKHNILSLLVLSMPLMLNAQVSEFRTGVVADGVNYVLPRTGIRADVSVYKTTFTPGEYARYAERYMHLKDVPAEPRTSYSISSINIYQYGEPDTLKYYTIKLKDKSVAPLAQLTPEGFLVSINTTVDVPTHQQPAVLTTHHKLDGHRYFTSEIMTAASTAKQAELIAQEIMDIRESKNSIRRGQIEAMPKDGASLKILLDELDQQESALMQLFTGYTDTTSVSETYSLMPDADVEKTVFFRFSQKLGLLDHDDLAGEPYYISVHDQHTVPLPTEAEAKKRKINGIVYNMPSMASVRIFTPQSTIYDKDLPFPQFGTVDVLAPTLFGKDATTTVTFNPEVGSLVKIGK